MVNTKKFIDIMKQFDANLIQFNFIGKNFPERDA